MTLEVMQGSGRQAEQEEVRYLREEVKISNKDLKE